MFQKEEEDGRHGTLKNQYGFQVDQVMKDEAGKVGRDQITESLLNLIKDTNLHFEGTGGPLIVLTRKMTLAIKENGLEAELR